MAVYDRWHKSHPREGDTPCRCSRGKTKLYPNADHGKGPRWQVRWRDEAGKQRKRNFVKKDGVNPETCADAFDAKVKTEPQLDLAGGAQKFRAYADQVLDNRAVDGNTRHEMRLRLTRHVYPAIGDTALRACRPSTIQALIRRLERAGLGPGYIRLTMINVETVFTSALEDGLIARNPCAAKSVTLPPVIKKRVVPWTGEQVATMREQLPGHAKAMIDVAAGLGLRQGEVFGLSPDDVEWLATEPVVHIRRQVKHVRRVDEDGKTRRVLVFAPPKGQKERTVPLPESVKLALAEHMRAYPSAAVSLPWKTADGDPASVRLLFTDAKGRAWDRDLFGPDVWRPALERAGIVPKPKKGEKCAPARQHGMHALRHYFASLLLSDGEDIAAVSEWMGHSKPSITLDIYTHLMPKSRARMRGIIDAAMEPAAEDSPSRLPKQH